MKTINACLIAIDHHIFRMRKTRIEQESLCNRQHEEQNFEADQTGTITREIAFYEKTNIAYQHLDHGVTI